MELVLDDQERVKGMPIAASALMPWPSNGSAEQDADRLTNWLFADNRVRRAWNAARKDSRKRRVRLRVDDTAPLLQALPWELLQDPATQERIALSKWTPFSRYLAHTAHPGYAVDERPIRVLAAIANPEDAVSNFDLEPIDAEREWQTLQQSMATLDVELVRLPSPCSLSALEEAMEAGVHVLHMVAYNLYSRREGRTAFLLSDNKNRGSRVYAAEMADLFKQLRFKARATEARLQLAFLDSRPNAARSGHPASVDAVRDMSLGLISAGVPAVVSLQEVERESTAQEVVSVFYRSLLQHGLVDLACNSSRAAAASEQTAVSEQSNAACMPVLFTRLRGNRLFERVSSV